MKDLIAKLKQIIQSCSDWLYNALQDLKPWLKWLGIVLLILIPFIAGICAKEAPAANGFEKLIGWTTMLISVGYAVIVVIKITRSK